MLSEPKLERDVAAMASHAIRTLLPKGRATIAHVARVLSVTPRTLQRRLRARQTSFSQVLAATRVDLARSGLADGLTTTQLATVLGFSESSAVSRFLGEHSLTVED